MFRCPLYPSDDAVVVLLALNILLGFAILAIHSAVRALAYRVRAMEDDGDPLADWHRSLRE